MIPGPEVGREGGGAGARKAAGLLPLRAQPRRGGPGTDGRTVREVQKQNLRFILTAVE